MHGADRDILWLQRDFGIDVYNMFDTGQYLLKHFCDVAANKEYVSFAQMTQHITCNLHFVFFINRYQNAD
ncbi:putative 3'-5' exonuclease domain, ribonuclease H-like superfamily [Helianthus anomalus]